MIIITKIIKNCPISSPLYPSIKLEPLMTIKKQIDNKKIFKKIDFDSNASKLKM